MDRVQKLVRDRARKRGPQWAAETIEMLLAAIAADLTQKKSAKG